MEVVNGMKETLTTTARQAGQFLLRHFGKLKTEQVEFKTGAKDLVTFVDREAEAMIFESLRSNFSDHDLLGEESGSERSASGSGASFIVDPLDGTVNYAHGLPHFGISIARCQENEITHGLIYVPFLDEMYYAEKGCGATLNGERIQVSETTSLTDAIVATGFACVRGKRQPDGVPVFSQLIYKTRDLRRLGAATVDLAYTARGLFSGFYEMSLSPWDVAAGALIVKEAGGNVTAFESNGDPIFGDTILATNGHIHDELLAGIKQALEG